MNTFVRVRVFAPRHRVVQEVNVYSFDRKSQIYGGHGRWAYEPINRLGVNERLPLSPLVLPS